MSRWPIVKLGDVLRPDLDEVSVEGTDIYKMVGVLSYARGLFEREDVLGASTSYKTFYRLHEGQLVLSQLFGWEGALAMVSPAFAGRYVSSQFPTFRPIGNRILPAFVGWCIRRSNLWEQLKGKAKGMGDRRRTLNPASLLSCEIPLPPVAEQRRIVAQLDRAAALVTERQAVCKDIQRELKALLSAAFRKIVSNAPSVRMNDVAPLTRRPVDVDPEATYNEIGARSFGRGLFHKPPLRGVDLTWQKLFRIEEGDLVFSNIKAWEGAFAVARAEHHGCVGSHRYLTCVVDRARAHVDFIWFYLQSQSGIEQVQAASPGSADRNRTLSQKRMEAIGLPLPSLNAQLWFVDLQMKAQAILATQAEASKEIDHLIPSLLDRAFNGEVEEEGVAPEELRAMA